MRWSPEKLRWLSLGGALLLAGVVAAFFGLARYSKGKVWQRILARNGVNLVRESKGITYSQSVGGRTVFTVHAARSVPHGEGEWTLHDAVLILYGKDGRNDRISGSQFEYNERQGVLRAMGEVHMDLSAPQGSGGGSKGSKPELSFAPEDGKAEDPGLIHVRTSGLVYMRKLSVAATRERAEFKYGGMTCTSQGAEFDSGQNVLRLLSDVHLSGTLRKAAFTLAASRAVLDRTADTAEMAYPRIESGERSASARSAVLHLNRDGSLASGDAEGEVHLASRTESVSAPRLHAVFGAQNRVENAVLSGGVRFGDTNAARAASGTAENVTLTTDASGSLAGAVADGAVALLVTQPAKTGPASTREVHAEKATAAFAPEPGGGKRAVLHTLRLTGGARLVAETVKEGAQGPQPTHTTLTADELTTTFSPDASRRAEPQRMVGTGNTRLEQTGSEGQRQVSTGDALDVSFGQRLRGGNRAADGPLEVSSAVQTGHVAVQSWPAVKRNAGAANPAVGAPGPSTGHAQQAVFDAAAGTLTLTGAGDLRAEVEDGGTQIRAPRIVLMEGTGNGEASGGVTATTAAANGGEATHVLAPHAVLMHEADSSEFDGTDAEPVQLWQAGSQVRAAKIVLDGQHHTMSARPERPGGTVNAVFASAHDRAGGDAGRGRATEPGSARRAAQPGDLSGAAAKVPEASRDTVQVRAAALDYNEAQREATFSGGVLVRDAAGEVTGRRAAAFLQAGPGKAAEAGLNAGAGHTGMPGANLGGRLERLVVVGEVRITEPGRTGSGEQLTYTAATNNFVLTGTPGDPPKVRDQQQGLVTGATLVFGASDSSIVVAGAHASGDQSKPTRVHTETDIRQH